jgi:hypothetical protein
MGAITSFNPSRLDWLVKNVRRETSTHCPLKWPIILRCHIWLVSPELCLRFVIQRGLHVVLLPPGSTSMYRRNGINQGIPSSLQWIESVKGCINSVSIRNDEMTGWRRVVMNSYCPIFDWNQDLTEHGFNNNVYDTHSSEWIEWCTDSCSSAIIVCRNVRSSTVERVRAALYLL